MLLHLVDGTGEHAGEAYKTVRAELEAYGQGLADKPEIVALTKIDALTPETIKQQAARLKRAARKRRWCSRRIPARACRRRCARCWTSSTAAAATQPHAAAPRPRPGSRKLPLTRHGQRPGDSLPSPP